MTTSNHETPNFADESVNPESNKLTEPPVSSSPTKLDELETPSSDHAMISTSTVISTKSSSQEAFNEQIQKRNFFEAFATVFDKMVNLDIMTIVEDEGVTVTPEKLSALEGLSGQRLITRISLLDGDIKNIIGSRFLKDSDYKELIEFHRKQVEQGQDIINKNLDSLQKAIDYLKKLSNSNQRSN